MRKKSGMQNSGGYSNKRRHNHGNNNRPRKNYSASREKYLSQARDALASGDRVQAENFFQHAEHCYRMMMEEGHHQRHQNQNNQNNNSSKNDDGDQNKNNDTDQSASSDKSDKKDASSDKSDKVVQARPNRGPRNKPSSDKATSETKEGSDDADGKQLPAFITSGNSAPKKAAATGGKAEAVAQKEHEE